MAGARKFSHLASELQASICKSTLIPLKVDAVVTILNDEEKKEYMKLNERIKEKEDEMLSKFMPEEEEEEEKN
ncbi:unnamed protein product [Cylicostephanus goldi]|uniref:Uncharacterized protein n=1 Tax=Cylicostephanus goldi TaxID=71465 RepID=A0A3P6TET3_CYLGO|nr:unnamed protein product [Cylicostephanus goldi]